LLISTATGEAVAALRATARAIKDEIFMLFMR
jgi:hypothetical protein